MRTVFAIAPWEYPGATFDPNAHAFTRHVFVGRERNLWLKMREGVIYFGEVEGERVYAVTRLFDDAIALDAERLIAVWRSEVERENYGVSLVCRHQWKNLFAIGSFCLILRADNSGWIQEHFDEDWQEFASLRAKPVQLWNDKLLDKTDAFIVGRMQTQFLERTVDPMKFQSVAPFWVGSAEQVSLLTQSAAQLWLIPTLSGDNIWNTHKMLHWVYHSNNAFFASNNGSPFSAYPWNPQFSWIHDLITWHHTFVGVEWKQASKVFDFERHLKPEIKQRWQRGLSKWGENWRGNFAGRQCHFGFHEPPLLMPTERDKIEASFVMREFLTDKLPAEEIEAMLRDALQN